MHLQHQPRKLVTSNRGCSGSHRRCPSAGSACRPCAHALAIRLIGRAVEAFMHGQQRLRISKLPYLSQAGQRTHLQTHHAEFPFAYAGNSGRRNVHASAALRPVAGIPPAVFDQSRLNVVLQDLQPRNKSKLIVSKSFVCKFLPS